MDDSAALLGASKRRGTAARPLSPSSLSINSVESKTRPVSFSTQYGLTYNAESNGHPDVHVIGECPFEDFMQLSILNFIRAPFNIS